MKTVVYYLKPHLSRMIRGLTTKFIGSIMDLFLPWLLAFTIDSIIPLENISFILLAGLAMIICAILSVVCNIVANRIASRVAKDTVESLRYDLFVRISHLSNQQIDSFSISSLETRLTTDTYNIHRMIGMIQRLGIRAPILLIGGIVITLSLDFVLALTLIAMMPFIAIVAYFVSRRGIPLYNKLQIKIDEMVRVVRENVTGIRVVKALSKTEYEKGRFAKANQNVSSSEQKAGITVALSNPLMNLFLNIGLTAVVLIGAYRVNEGLMQPGKILAFLTYFTIILQALLSINRMFILYSKASASADRIEEVLTTPEDLLVTKLPFISTNYHILFDNVTFSYHKEVDNISNINFALKKGETLGIIGSTGSGKSTIIRLLMRFYDVDSGTIYIDGKDIRSIPNEELHTMFGVVFQNDVLFADTIFNNIDFGRGLSLEEVEFAAKNAQATEFIHNLSDGYQHKLTMRATNISGGQKQRVLLSRALAGNPDILVLDDSSSALDYQTDAKLRKALNTYYRDTTTVIIAQRISSIMKADHILVLEDGRPLGYGTHNELLKTCQAYQEISISQLGGIEYVNE